MMSGSRGSDPRISSLGEIFTILRLLANPGGLAQALGQLEEAHQAVLADLQTKGETADQKESAANAAMEAAVGRSKAMDLREVSLTDFEQKLKQNQALLAEEQAGLLRVTAKHREDVADLKTRKEALEQSHIDHMAALDIEHSRRMKKLEDERAKVGNHLDLLDKRSADLEVRNESLITREAEVRRREGAADKLATEAEAARKEYQSKLAAMKSLVGA